MMKKLIGSVIISAIYASLVGCGGGAGDAGGFQPSKPAGGGGTNQNTNSQAGSTATMLPYGDTLYILDQAKLKTVDLNTTPPKIVKEIPLRFPETLFIYEAHLYVGGETGVEIYDLTDPLSPLAVSSYQHIRSCDPIIVDDDIGYITLRSGNGNGWSRCGGLNGVNRLELVDMADPRAPKYISEFAMTNPYGLAKTEEFLAICQEEFGLSLLDVANVNAISIEATFPNIKCFDLIHTNNSLITTATDGIYQFGVDGRFITELSVIPVGEPVLNTSDI